MRRKQTRRHNRRTQKRNRRRSRRVRKMRGGADASTSGTNILLIIDPQNDFTAEWQGAALPVDNAQNDYKKIVAMLDRLERAGKTFDEIHVSLDTHTPNHIGHKGYWKRVDGNVLDDSVANGYGISTIKYDESKGNFILTPEPIFDGRPQPIEVEPKNKIMKEYTKIYINNVNKTAGIDGLYAMLWPQHCLEKTDGHKVHDTLETKLKELKGKGKTVKYHIKGQNELAEMYSIFGAKVSVNDVMGQNPDVRNLLNQNYNQYAYTGNNSQNRDYNKTAGVDTYEQTITSLNLDTQLNIEFMRKLLGENNKVYVCGEARTHCVKSSLNHLLKYAQENGSKDKNIYFISDASSPIPGVLNDIVRIVSGNPDRNDEPEPDLKDEPNVTTESPDSKKQTVTYNGKIVLSTELNLQ